MVDWAACLAEVEAAPLVGTVRRLVESQEQIATNQLVRSLEQQAVLEEMLDGTKPAPRRGSEHLHYLLATPFRYPPLPHGSRFGMRTEPSLFYGSMSQATVLAEAAYYRFVFWHGMAIAPAASYVTQHTLFGAAYQTQRGLKLQAPPFASQRDALTDPIDYRQTQQLGSAMRTAGIEAFEFESARDPDHGINVALFSPAALAQAAPKFTEAWLCETSGTEVRFYARHGAGIYEFPVEQFQVAGKLPQPAV